MTPIFPYRDMAMPTFCHEIVTNDMSRRSNHDTIRKTLYTPCHLSRIWRFGDVTNVKTRLSRKKTFCHEIKLLSRNYNRRKCNILGVFLLKFNVMKKKMACHECRNRVTNQNSMDFGGPGKFVMNFVKDVF